MTVLLSALAFLVLLTGLILIHEMGHFLAARRAGVEVEEFGFGLPPKIKDLFVHRGTVFTLNWIPFGGFVRLKGENAMEDGQRTAPGSFGAVSVWKRIQILVAGVFMNYLLAVVLLTIGFSVGRWIPTYMSLEAMQSAAERGYINLTLSVLIDDTVKDSNAERAGVPPKSLLIAVDDVPVTLPADVLAAQEGKSRVVYTVLSGEGYETKETYRVSLAGGQAGVKLIGYARDLSSPKRSLRTASALALRESWVMTQQTVSGIGHLFWSLGTTGTVPEGITGIVGIAQLTHVSVQKGFMTYLRLVALLSLSLAVLNILPFPALDGGRLLFVIAEFISRRPVNRRFEIMTNAVGFVFLIFLILVITFYDIIRLF